MLRYQEGPRRRVGELDLQTRRPDRHHADDVLQIAEQFLRCQPTGGERKGRVPPPTRADTDVVDAGVGGENRSPNALRIWWTACANGLLQNPARRPYSIDILAARGRLSRSADAACPSREQ